MPEKCAILHRKERDTVRKRLIAACLALTLPVLGTSAWAVETARFADVPKNAWCYAYVSELTERGVVSGYPDGNFYPDQVLTREEFAKLLAVAAGLQGHDAAFTDVPREHWAWDFIGAVGPCMAPGQTAFRPKDTATRAEVAQAVGRALGWKAEEADESALAGFSDAASLSAESRPWMALAVERGLISGYVDGTLRGGGSLARSEAAAILCRAFPDEEPAPEQPANPLPPPPADAVEPEAPAIPDRADTAVVPRGYVGYSSLEQLDAMAVKDQQDSYDYLKAHRGKGLSQKSYQGKECVYYALERSREKLFGGHYYLPMWSGNANQMVDNFVNNGFTKDASQTLTAGNGVSFAVRTYLPEDGIDGIRANSFVCLTRANTQWAGRWGWSINKTYGHVIYIEEIAQVGGVEYAYFTEGGSGFRSWPVKRMPLTELYDEGRGYLGCIAFEPV